MLLSLPPELLDNICLYLDTHHLCALAQTCDRLHAALRPLLQQLHNQQQLVHALEMVLKKVAVGFSTTVPSSPIPQTHFIRSLSLDSSEAARVLKTLVRGRMIDGESETNNTAVSLSVRLGKLTSKHLQLAVDTVAAILSSFPKCKSNSLRACFMHILGSCAVLLQHATSSNNSHNRTHSVLKDVTIPHLTIQEATTPIINRKSNRKSTSHKSDNDKQEMELRPLLNSSRDRDQTAVSSAVATSPLPIQLSSCMTVNELVVTVTDVLQQFLRECAEAGVYQSTEELILATATALHDISQVTDDILEDILLDLLDSKGQYQKSGACKAFCSMTSFSDIDRLKHRLLSRLKGHGGNCEREAAIILNHLERLGYYDNRLINTLDICLRTESHAVNALGLREASVHALKTFKVPPNGRPCFEIFWVDKLQRGRSKLCRVFALLLGLSLVLFPILFFSLLYGQIVSLNRAVQTTGRIIDISWQYKWSACGETGICYEGFLTIEYQVKHVASNNGTAVGTAMVYCSAPVGATSCPCCEHYIKLYRDSTVTTVWYDPYDLRIVFMKRHLDSFAWRNALFHTLFWPLLLAFFPVIAMWPYMWYAWNQSRREKGLPPPTFCHKLSSPASALSC